MKIRVEDKLHPEDNAMVQALYSRSKESVDEHLAKVEKVGSGKFMDQYYVGYGHKSIGDCGTTTIFIEGVSMLAAKAIQDWPLYSGQEKSTRYIDFTEVEFMDPLGMYGLKEGEEVQEGWRKFYKDALPEVIAHLQDKYPRQAEENEGRYDKAIRSRAFDILRGFLPAGAQTQLSWHTNLRQADDHLRWMHLHPLAEVQRIALQIQLVLQGKYPHSFSGEKWSKVDSWMSVMTRNHHHIHRQLGEDDPFYYFYDPEAYPESRALTQSTGMLSIPEEMSTRPRGAPIPHWLDELGQITSKFYLDFGSYRDIQRHRNGVIRMPWLSHTAPLHQWYVEQLPRPLQNKVAGVVMEQRAKIQYMFSRISDPYAIQYYCPMGNLVPIQVTQGLPGFIYRLELRSSKTVHPTLRQVVLREAAQFRERFPRVALHTDDDPDSWTVRRGDQDIVEKSST